MTSNTSDTQSASRSEEKSAYVPATDEDRKIFSCLMSVKAHGRYLKADRSDAINMARREISRHAGRIVVSTAESKSEIAASMPTFNVYGFGKYLGQTTTVATAEEAIRQIAQERGLRRDRLTAHAVKP